jgi:hypothetical protein
MTDTAAAFLVRRGYRLTAAGWVKGDDDICHGPDAVDAITGELGICGCGVPEEALRVYRDALRLVAMTMQTKPTKRPREALFHGDSGLEFFVWYRLDDLGLTEHGGCVPGWLTDDGKALLDALNAFPYLNVDSAND